MFKKKLTTENFIEKAKKVHGNKYNYSKVEYKGCNEKICIICPEHGEFWQIPSSHLSGKGCSKCYNKKRGNKLKLTTEQFIEEAKQIHGDKYNYSKVNYVNRKTKVCIICPIHGEFWQSPSCHIFNKNGCPKCCKTGVKYTIEDFKEKVNKIHNGKIYVAKDAEYINSHTKIKMICPEHGEFWTKPNYILCNHGCPICGNLIVKEKLRFTLKDFIEKAKKVHKNEYDYSLSQYEGYDIPTKIICHNIDKNGKEHGIFLQSPHSHLMGCGCPKCSMSNLERKIYNLLEINNIKYEYEKHFEWLGMQSLDFYLPDYNIAIECQGIQHFEPCNFGSDKKTAEEMFEYVKECDNKKYKLCKENGIKLIYYKQNKLPNWITNKEDYFSRSKLLIEYIKHYENF